MTGLTIHRSERADPLVAALGDVLAHPTGDPFTPEVVAVPSRGVERWLAQQLSHVLGAVDGDGVCANVHFPSSDALVDDAAAAVDPAYAAAVRAWSASRSVWTLLPVIERAIGTAPWASVLDVHLGSVDGHDRGRRFAVANKLARHFERYGRARPAMLREWSERRDDLSADLAWQAQLWRELRAELGPSPAELLDATCSRLRDRPEQVPLPGRLSIFGITRMSPSRAAVLGALAHGRDVHVWLHHPSPVLWQSVAEVADAPGRRRRDVTALAIGNPLLASLSRDVRELQTLLTGGASEVTDVHHALGSRPDTLLGRLQRDLADDSVPAVRRPISPDDRSISVHAAHGPARQVEVVREVVLGLLRDDPTLEPRDIVIMCPDVEAFAPLVAASFGMTDEPGGHPAARLRVRLADRALQQTNPMLALLEQLLALGAQRVTATELLDLAGSPPVRARFGFTDDDVEQLRARAMGANVRWGLDAAHRAPYGLAGIAQGTWRAALDRMLLGVAMEEGDAWVGDVLPLDDVDSGAIDLVGRFAEFVDRVDQVVRQMEQPHPVARWAALLAEASLAIGEPARAWQGAQLRGELDDLADAATDTDVLLGRADIATLVADRLSGRPTRASFRTGTLTVCTLVPMRSVPHRVVCLLGMDDGAFPRHGVVDGDDVLARDPATGERDVRSEDRQLFLDAICAATDHLVVTYTGADPRTGVTVPPCVPLGELLDAVDASAAAPDGGPARTHVVVHHPLQPFDVRNFTAGRLGVPRAFSFDPSGLAGARAAVGPQHVTEALIGRALEAVPDDSPDVDLEDLLRFVTAPMREFLRQRLLISTWQDDDEPEDALPLDMKGLPEWSVGERILRLRLGGMPVEKCVALEVMRGDLPPGRIGEKLVQRVGRTVDALLGECGDLLHVEPHAVDVAVPLDNGRTLSGTVTGIRGHALVSVTYSSLGPKPRLQSWIRYLAVLSQTEDGELRALAVGKGPGGSARRCAVRGIDPAEARGILTDLVDLRAAGLRSPLPIALKTSEVYAARLLSTDDPDEAFRSANSRWRDGDYPGECSEPAHTLVLGPQPSLRALMDFDAAGDPDLRFAPLAQRLWRTLASAETR